MKIFLIIAAGFIAAGALHAQDPLDAPELEQSLQVEDFSSVIKSVWDVMKKGADEYQEQTTTRTEFETATDFEARLQQRRNDIAARIHTYVESKKLATRLFAVWLSAKLVHYNADTQTYSVTSSTEISVPPSTEDVMMTCPPNQYVSLIETTRRGYKFAHLLLKTKPEYSWHVDVKTARAAKDDESNVFFKVWFRFDPSQAFSGTASQLALVPVKIALVNKRDNTTYWSDDILK